MNAELISWGKHGDSGSIRHFIYTIAVGEHPREFNAPVVCEYRSATQSAAPQWMRNAVESIKLLPDDLDTLDMAVEVCRIEKRRKGDWKQLERITLDRVIAKLVAGQMGVGKYKLLQTGYYKAMRRGDTMIRFGVVKHAGF